MRTFFLLLLPVLALASERDMAEWVLRWEGVLTIEGQRQPIRDLSQLPAGEVRILGVDLTGTVMPPTELVKLAGLTHLRDLFLPGPVWNPGGGNENANYVFQTLAKLTNLERLYVGWHFATTINIRDEGITALRGLTKLKDFRCSQCTLSKVDFSSFASLRSLDLNNTPFTDAGLESLANLKQLRRLLLRDTLVTDEGLKHLAELTQLEELDLSGTRITDKGIASLRKLTLMRVLSVRGAQATDASLDVFAGMTNLRALDLYRTRITNAGVARLSSLPQLTDVDLRYTRVTSNGVEALRAALPQAKVQFIGAATMRAKDTGAARPVSDTEEGVAAWVKAIGGKASLEDGHLRVVDLATTPVSDAQLAFLSKLSRLEELHLQATQVGDLSIQALAGLPRLRLLDLSNSTVSDAGLATLAKLGSLEVLRLAGTLVEGQVEGLGLDQLAALPNLRELDLGATRLDDRALPGVGKLTGLTRLRLSYTEISDGGLQHIAGLQKLESLQLAGTDIGDAALVHIGKFTHLRELNLNQTRFTDDALVALKPLVNLERIEMFRTRAGNAGTGVLASLKKLKVINLDYTAVDDKGLVALQSLPAMKELSLDNANVTDLGIASLKAMPSLTSLNLYHTLVSEKGYDELKKTLPSCRIVFDRDSALPNRRTR